MSKEKIKIMVMPNCRKLGEKVDLELQRINKVEDSYLVDFKAERFDNGEGKVEINGDVSDSDLYILSDVGNYEVSYPSHGMLHYMGPDEHFADIKRAIGATNGRAEKVNVIMPLLYQSRQHKIRGNESRDCAMALQELERLNIDSIVSFDVHAPDVCNAIPGLPFYNFYPTHFILEKLIAETEDLDKFFVVSPDMGATERARYYAEMLECDIGTFYKRRGTKVENGKNPIAEHTYMGRPIEDENVLIVDDMVSSGGSILEVAKTLKEKMNVRKVFLASTFALFTEGAYGFLNAYDEGWFDKFYSTNLSYVPKGVVAGEWYQEVDCSKYLASIIDTKNKGGDISKLYNGKEEIRQKIKAKKRSRET